jgi:hypothetical protein
MLGARAGKLKVTVVIKPESLRAHYGGGVTFQDFTIFYVFLPWFDTPPARLHYLVLD